MSARDARTARGESPATLIAATDATFNRLVLRSALPAVVLFAAPWCEACRALRQALRALAADYAGRLVVAEVDADAEAMLVDQYGVESVPTLSLYLAGQEILRAVGFLQEGLLRLLFAQALVADGDRPRLWSPTEEQFEDTVLVPLLTRWGLRYIRQYPCAPRSGSTTGHDRVDFYVYMGDVSNPFTLFENKRRIAGDYDLRQAVAQAGAYAQALRLRSFVVAAPGGMWVYALRGRRATLAQYFSGLEIACDDGSLVELLMRLRSG